jgi:transcriptional regulator with XRE-family HTH domain
MSNYLGEYLQTLRATKKLSTRQLGVLATCDYSFISRIEAGQRFPSLDRLWQFIDLLEGDFGRALYLLCLDQNIPESVASQSTRQRAP